MASTLRLSPGGSSGGGEPPPPEDPGGDGPAAAPPGGQESAGQGLAGRPMCPVCNERFSRGSRFCAFDGTRLVDTPEEASKDPLVGQTVGGKYLVTRTIGEGGMGTVYEVRHTALDRRFALKVLRPEIAQNAEHMQRFLLEARAAAAIGHPNIVSVSDFGECEVRGKMVPFFVMEYLRGASLAAHLKAVKRLSSSRSASIIAACAEALGAAHAAGVIHRDLKPDNIFLSGDHGEHVKVLDFGVAKMQGAARLTRVGMVFGTPHYMSPEQARGNSVDHRADIYALGVILYECLAGRVPFEADTSMGVLTKQIFANPEPIERVMPDARELGALGAVVMRCLAKEPDERFASMEELAAALRRFLQDPAAALEPAGAPRRAGMRLREDAAMPPPSPPDAEPEPRAWSRMVIFAAAGVAVLALIIVSVRAAVLMSDAPASSEAEAASVQAPAPPAPSSAEPAATAPAPATAPPSASPAAPSSSSASVPAPSTRATSGAQAGASTAAPRASTAATTAPTVTAKPTSAGIVDPWSKPTTKKPPSDGVVDPWAKKK